MFEREKHFAVGNVVAGKRLVQHFRREFFGRVGIDVQPAGALHVFERRLFQRIGIRVSVNVVRARIRRIDRIERKLRKVVLRGNAHPYVRLIRTDGEIYHVVFFQIELELYGIVVQLLPVGVVSGNRADRTRDRNAVYVRVRRFHLKLAPAVLFHRIVGRKTQFGLLRVILGAESAVPAVVSAFFAASAGTAGKRNREQCGGKR